MGDGIPVGFFVYFSLLRSRLHQNCSDSFKTFVGDGIPIGFFIHFSLGEIGSGVHSDYGGITVLHADGPGLYVLRPNQTSAEVLCGPSMTDCLEVFGNLQKPPAEVSGRFPVNRQNHW